MVKRWRSTAMAAVVLAACTGSGAAGPTRSISATVDDMTGEWQPMPLTISDAAIQQLDEECLSFDFMAPGVSLVVADARGESRVHLLYAGQDGHNGTCEATVGSGGQIETGPTSATAELGQDPPMEAMELRVYGGQTSPGSARPEDWWQQIMGQAGTEIHGVIAQVTGLPPIVASLGGGWFTLWYPVDAGWDYQLVGVDSAGNEVALVVQRPTG